jgi:hypothetical protein
MSYQIKSDFLLVKKIKIHKVFKEKFINEMYINNYKFFNILETYIKNLKEIFAKDSYDKMIDKF